MELVFYSNCKNVLSQQSENNNFILNMSLNQCIAYIYILKLVQSNLW